MLTQKLHHIVLASLVVLALGACARKSTMSVTPDLGFLIPPAEPPVEAPIRFGLDGLVVAEDVAFRVTAMKALSDGNIIVGGYASEPLEGINFRLIRLLSDGRIDTSFGDNGKVSTHFGFGDDYLNDLAIAVDGSIVATGRGFGGVNDDLAVARYLANGQLDMSFGTNGRVLTDLQPGAAYTYDNGNAILIQASGKIVVVGETHQNCRNIVARYMPDGSLDRSFGTSGTGIEVIYFSGNHDTLNAVAFSPSGQIIAAGTIADGRDFAIARLSVDGILDNSFDGDGKVILNFNAVDMVTSVAVRSDGKVAISGYSGSANNQSMFVFQLGANGALDTSFANAGSVALKLDAGTTGMDRLYDSLLLSDGSILGVGRGFRAGYYYSSFVRLLANGQLDSGFGNGGVLGLTVNSDSDEANYALDLRSGKMLAAGNAIYPNPNSIVVRQLSLSGVVTP